VCLPIRSLNRLVDSSGEQQPTDAPGLKSVDREAEGAHLAWALHAQSQWATRSCWPEVPGPGKTPCGGDIAGEGRKNGRGEGQSRRGVGTKTSTRTSRSRMREASILRRSLGLAALAYPAAAASPPPAPPACPSCKRARGGTCSSEPRSCSSSPQRPHRPSSSNTQV